MRDQLALVSANKQEVKKMGQLYGLQFHASGILWHPSLKHKLCPVKQNYYDWMHILLASGGLGQYEINEFVKKIRGMGIPLKQLDDFASVVFFSQRLYKAIADFFPRPTGGRWQCLYTGFCK